MDLLSDILSHMQLSGTLYFRTSFTSPWSIRVPPYENVSRFHFAHKGRCLVRIDPDAPPVLLKQGDLVIITRGAAHTLYCDPKTENQAVQLDTVVENPASTARARWSGVSPGPITKRNWSVAISPSIRTPTTCCSTHCHRTLTSATTARRRGSGWKSTLKVIGTEAGRSRMGGDLIALKMSEIIFAQALRVYLSSEGANQSVLSCFADPHISRALTAIHENPSFPWTLASLAKLTGMSRTSFVTRFARCMSMTPIGYVTHWRMQLARKDLEQSDQPIIEIAE